MSNIKSWAAEDRPREKMLEKGEKILTDAELLAIILGSGSRNESAVQLAQRMLSEAGGLDNLAKKDLHFYKQFKGVGDAKAITVSAAMELGRRRKTSKKEQKIKITSSVEAYQLLAPQLSDLNHEEFWVACCDRRNHVIWKERISSGGVAGTIVDPKIVFKIALSHLASSIIFYHNHPSGAVSPSTSDKLLTQKLVKGAEALDILVLDHIIIGSDSYYSFKDENLL
jgi:DNA repair protein RadC